MCLALLLAACGGDGDASGSADGSPTPASPTGGVLNVRASEWGFEPDVIAFSRGERVQIVLVNDGDILHNLKIEKELTADDIESRSSGPLRGGEGQLFVGAEAGGQGTLTFVPQESGTFVFYCTIEGHRQLGMEGRLTVE